MSLTTITIPWLPITSIVLCYWISIALYRLLFHPLAKFPGPKLAAISRLYEAYYDVVKGGQYTFRIAELHQQYGEPPATKYQPTIMRKVC